MATTQAAPPQAVPAQAVPAQGPAAARGPLPAPGAEAKGETTVLALPDSENPMLNPRVVQLPVELDVVVPVRDFRVRNLLALQPEQLIESQWGNGEDVPLASGAVRLAWGEFEVIDSQLAVRITRTE